MTWHHPGNLSQVIQYKQKQKNNQVNLFTASVTDAAKSELKVKVVSPFWMLIVKMRTGPKPMLMVYSPSHPAEVQPLLGASAPRETQKQSHITILYVSGKRNGMNKLGQLSSKHENRLEN